MENLNRSGDGTYCSLLIAHCSLGIWGPPTAGSWAGSTREWVRREPHPPSEVDVESEGGSWKVPFTRLGPVDSTSGTCKNNSWPTRDRHGYRPDPGSGPGAERVGPAPDAPRRPASNRCAPRTASRPSSAREWGRHR